MLDIVEIGTHRNAYPIVEESRFDSLDGYLKIARKVIHHFGSRYSSHIVKQMLSSDDDVANMAHHLMKADWEWVEGRVGPRGKNMSKRTYRNYRGLCAMKKYIERQVTMGKKPSTYSLDAETGSSNKFHNLVEDRRLTNPSDIVERQDMQEKIRDQVNQLLSSGVLSPKQERFIRLQYLEEMSQADIARQEGVTREAVRQVVERGMARLRELAQ